MAIKGTPEPMPYTKAHHLLNPLRSLILSPRRLVSRLNVTLDSRVLELGPGPGYYSPEVARAIPGGSLILVDVQQEMLDMAKERLDKRGIGNVEYRKGDATSLPVANESIDVAFLVAVLGEVPERDACLREIHRVLKKGGLLSISEIKHGDPHFIAMNEMTRMAQRNGFSLSTEYAGLFHYTVNFAK